MKKLTKEAISERDDLQERFGTAFTTLETAVDAFNTAVDKAWEDIETARDDYNELISDANQWQLGIVEAIRKFIDDHSEKWQESDKGQQYESWKNEFEEEFPTISLDKPDELTISDVEDMSELLGNRNESLWEEE
jgi:DNA repair exonuclease SbcCD ATPase subunit